MAAAATWAGVDIPLLFSYETTYDIGGNFQRTAGGKMRFDFIYSKRKWVLKTRPITTAQSDAIIDALTAASWGTGAFWIQDFGATSNTVPAYLRIDDISNDIENVRSRNSLTLSVYEE